MKKTTNLMILILFCLSLFASNSYSQSWKSSDPNDLEVLCNTVWKFSLYYPNNQKLCADIVYFRDNIDIDANYVSLPCENFNWSGTVVYGEYETDDVIHTGFICTLSPQPADGRTLQYRFNILTPETVTGEYILDPVIFDPNNPSNLTSPLDISNDDNNLHRGIGCFIELLKKLSLIRIIYLT